MELCERVVDGGVDGHALPVRKEVDTDEVDVVSEIRVGKPDMPRLGGTHGLADRVPGAIEVLLKFLRRQLAAEHDLVADDHAHHVRMGARKLDGGFELLVVVLAVIVDPRAERNVDVVPGGELGDVAKRPDRTVGAHRSGLSLQQLQIGVDLGIGRHFVVGRVLARPERREGEALDARRPGRLGGRAIQKRPDREGQCRENRRNQQAG